MQLVSGNGAQSGGHFSTGSDVETDSLLRPHLRLVDQHEEALRWLANAAWPDDATPPPLDPVDTARYLAVLNPHELTPDRNLDYMQVAGRLANWVSSRQNEALSEFAQANGAVATPDAVDAEVAAAAAAASQTDAASEGPAGKAAPAPAEIQVDPTMSIRNFLHYPAMEVAAVLNTSVTVASGMCARALTMELLPNSQALHREGLIDLARIRSITSGLLHAPLSMYRVLDAEIAKKARQLTPKKLEAYVRLRVERHQSRSLADRHSKARTERSVFFTALPDGMAELTAILPAVKARQIYETLNAWATSAHTAGQAPNGMPSSGLTPGGRPSRSFNNYLADAFMDLCDIAVTLSPEAINTTLDELENYEAAARGFRPAAPAAGVRSAGSSDVSDDSIRRHYPVAQIQVTVPALAMLGHTSEPAILDGYGPIPLDQAIHLAGTATSWLRILTDPATGLILDYGQDRYKPPKELLDFVRNRDQTCRGIGCDKPARSCEIDHTVPFHRKTYEANGTARPPGDTHAHNLGSLCHGCHHIKDDLNSGWTTTQPSPGLFVHTSPHGRQYTKHRDVPAIEPLSKAEYDALQPLPDEPPPF
ncbi:MAG: DUF222 domain-containing protein [Acidobacteria bacterium]|nr:DUF222 domain-containing protein [Acidobacteriota bacterium]